MRVVSCAQVLRPSARELVLAALPGVDELRSTTSRMALLFFQVRLEALHSIQAHAQLLEKHTVTRFGSNTRFTCVHA